MPSQALTATPSHSISNTTLTIIAFATAFFPRILTYFGAPDPLNFLHFLTVPIAVGVTLFKTPIKDRKQITIVWELLVALGIFLACMTASAIVNNAGVLNVILQLMLLGEPYVLLIGIMALPLKGERLELFRKWLLRFALSNLLLAIAQALLLPIGLYPRRGGTLADNTAGVFASGPGSAGNYVSCTVSLYFSGYALLYLKQYPLWWRILGALGALYQTQVSDSKQVFLAFGVAGFLLILTKVENPFKLLLYLLPIILAIGGLAWALQNPSIEFLDPYRNWTSRAEIYGPDGEATRTKLAAFRIVPSYFTSPLNWLVGLGPGHTVTRLGGWMLKKYAPFLVPLGATVHPASAEVFQVVFDGWIAQESTIFFPLFTWAGLWGDFGMVGLAAYFYIAFVIWKRICVDDFCKFVVLTNFVFGFILTQMEEPGQMLTVACLLALRWFEERDRQLQRLEHQRGYLQQETLPPT